MTGRHDTTYSPSSSNTRRSTPCVEGCCGPMLMIMVSCPMAMAIPSEPSLVGWRDERALVLGVDAGEWMVLAERVAHPPFGHLDPPKVGMAVEADAEEIEHLPLEPV